MKGFAATMLVLLLAAWQAQAQTPPPIIDMHLHAYPIGSIWAPGAPNPATAVSSPETDDALLSEVRSALDESSSML